MRLTSTAPKLCSSCFQQKLDEPHVDFDSAWDGPRFQNGVAGEDGEVVTTLPVSIDDLIICESCLRAALKLLPGDDRDDVIERLREQVRTLEADAEKRGEYVEKLEAAIAAKPEEARSALPAPLRRRRGA